MSVMLAERQIGRLTTNATVHFARAPRGRKELREGALPPPPTVPVGRVPRITRLMALAIRFERLVATGAVRDYAEIARLGYVTRARVTQIMNLLNLAPDLREDILFLPRVEHGRDRSRSGRFARLRSCPIGGNSGGCGENSRVHSERRMRTTSWIKHPAILRIAPASPCHPPSA